MGYPNCNKPIIQESFSLCFPRLVLNINVILQKNFILISRNCFLDKKILVWNLDDSGSVLSGKPIKSLHGHGHFVSG